MGWLAIPIGIGVGTGVTKKYGGGSWGSSLGYATATTLVAATIRNPAAVTRGSFNVARFLYPVIRVPVAFLWQDLLWPAARPLGMGILRSAGAIVGSQTALVISAAMMGYAIGAVTGTIIVSQAEKKGIVYEGATADVLDFYMGKGHYWAQGDHATPGYFNIPGNVRFITKHYLDRSTD